jgi:hypothetical protein
LLSEVPKSAKLGILDFRVAIFPFPHITIR